jgi:hypothetical protein
MNVEALKEVCREHDLVYLRTYPCGYDMYDNDQYIAQAGRGDMCSRGGRVEVG